MLQYRKAVPGDENAIIELMDTVFSERAPHNFASLMPKAYGRSGFYKLHYVAEEDGRIVSTIAVLPERLFPTPDTALEAGYIGNVCTAKEERGKGHITRLMEMLLPEAQEKYDLMILSGQRQLYGKYGFEPGAAMAGIRVTGANLRGLVGEVSFKELTARDTEELKRVCALMRQQNAMSERTEETVLDISHSWYTGLYAAYAGEKLVAYICAHPRNVLEVGTLTPEWIVPAVKCWVEQRGDSEVFVPLNDHITVDRLMTFAEGMRIIDCEKIRVFRWQKTLQTLLRAKAESTALIKGVRTVCITGKGTFRIDVCGEIPSVAETDEKADMELSEAEAVRRFFSASSVFTETDPLLRSWMPLPLAVRSVDQF